MKKILLIIILSISLNSAYSQCTGNLSFGAISSNPLGYGCNGYIQVSAHTFCGSPNIYINLDGNPYYTVNIYSNNSVNIAELLLYILTV